MATPVLTLGPEALRSASARSPWETALITFVREAAEQGQTVIVSTEERLLTPDEVARGLMMSRSTVSRKIAAGHIRSVKIGNRHRIPYQEYRRVWEETMRTVAQESAPDIEADLFADDE